MDLRGHIVEEFAISQRIVGSGVEVVPRFKIFAPRREYVAFVQMPDDPTARIKRLEAMRAFMIWKAASGFLLASELAEPDALMVVSVTRSDVIGAWQPITRQPVSFGRLQWLDRDSIDEAIVSLLPPKTLEVSAEDLEFMRRAFEEGEIEGISWRRHS